MSHSLNICYLLESAALCGGVRVVLDQARSLIASGHRVSILALHGDADWYPYPISLCQVSDFVSAAASIKPDVVVATFWTTVAPALACGAPLTVHLCQGLEYDVREYNDRVSAIEEAYAHPIPKLTVGPWLDAKLRQRFGVDAFPIVCVGQSVDTDLYRPVSPWQRVFSAWPARQGVRVLLPGLFEFSGKGISFALRAVRALRAEGREVHLVRVSTQPQNLLESEITLINEYHQAVTPRVMAELYRNADVVLTPSTEEEGFGLPFAEAMACGRAVVATKIRSYLSLVGGRDCAMLVPAGDVEALIVAMRTLMDDAGLRRRMGREGAALMRGRFEAAVVAQNIESAFRGWLNE